MGKLGIITFHSAHNYGSVLQAYALQKAIKRRVNYKCETINFIPPNQDEMYAVYCKNDSLKNVLKNTVAFFNKKMLEDRQVKFDNFINNRLDLSNKIYKSREELKNNVDDYDVLVCGSDQIWNISALDFDDSYFLTFSNNSKKISYAPSMGGGNPFNNDEVKNKISGYLQSFTALSVREERGKSVLNQIIDKDVEIVLDPTLLLGSEEWDEICSDRVIDGDYIFFYSIDYNDDVIKVVEKISKKLNLPVVVLYSTRKTYKAVIHGFKVSKYQSPTDFLSLIKHSKLVLSNSFHGNVFAIIYRKPFYVVRGTYNGEINTDDRMTTLLNHFNLQDRQININNVNEIDNYLIVDYNKSENLINNWREKSINYLSNSIGE